MADLDHYDKDFFPAFRSLFVGAMRYKLVAAEAVLKSHGSSLEKFLTLSKAMINSQKLVNHEEGAEGVNPKEVETGITEYLAKRYGCNAEQAKLLKGLMYVYQQALHFETAYSAEGSILETEGDRGLPFEVTSLATRRSVKKQDAAMKSLATQLHTSFGTGGTSLAECESAVCGFLDYLENGAVPEIEPLPDTVVRAAVMDKTPLPPLGLFHKFFPLLFDGKEQILDEIDAVLKEKKFTRETFCEGIETGVLSGNIQHVGEYIATLLGTEGTDKESETATNLENFYKIYHVAKNLALQVNALETGAEKQVDISGPLVAHEDREHLQRMLAATRTKASERAELITLLGRDFMSPRAAFTTVGNFIEAVSPAYHRAEQSHDR